MQHRSYADDPATKSMPELLAEASIQYARTLNAPIMPNEGDRMMAYVLGVESLLDLLDPAKVAEHLRQAAAAEPGRVGGWLADVITATDRTDPQTLAELAERAPSIIPLAARAAAEDDPYDDHPPATTVLAALAAEETAR